MVRCGLVRCQAEAQGCPVAFVVPFLALGDDMVVVGFGQDLGGCDQSYMNRVNFRWV